MTDRKSSSASSSVAEVDTRQVRENIIESLKTVQDPEIPVNVYDLGLIYDVDVRPDGVAHIKMTLTAQGCPASDYLQEEVQAAAQAAEGVRAAIVEIVWDPPWTLANMSDAARKKLGME